MTDRSFDQTGVPVLDDALGGGLPSQRAVLLTGGPGTGKTTLAMQFLQAGLSRGERCLFVSTEQTAAELADSFEPYEFDVAHENLTVGSIHATPGETLEGDGQVMTLDTLGGSEAATGVGGDGVADASISFGQYRQAFTPAAVTEFLQRLAPADRVVFDSISGLASVTEDERAFKRTVLDIIRLLSDTFGATSVLTAEKGTFAGHEGAESLHYTTHGVIELSRETVEGDFHRFLRILKMRGIAHDSRSFEMEFDHQGVHLLPENRTPSPLVSPITTLSTGIGGLDRLCGGGLLQGETVLLEHDGRAPVEALIANVMTQAIREGETIVLLPPSSVTPQRLDHLVAERIGSVDQLLADDKLFVLDLSGEWSSLQRNVFTIGRWEQRLRLVLGDPKPLLAWKMKRIFSRMNERRGDQSALAVVFTEALLQEFDPTDVRQMHYWAKKNLFVPEDTVLFVQNPAVMEDTLAEFFVYDAEQMLRTWMHRFGLQYLKLEKSPVGHLSSSRLVEHVEYPPYVRVQRPAGPRRDHREHGRTRSESADRPN